MNAFKFSLYLYLATPDHPEVSEEIGELKTILAGQFGTEYSLNIINVLNNPELAVKEGVVATPTLIRNNPPPPLRLVGDFTDKDKVLGALELTPPFQG